MATMFRWKLMIVLLAMVALAVAAKDGPSKKKPREVPVDDVPIMEDADSAEDQATAGSTADTVAQEEIEYRSPQLEKTKFHLYEHFDNAATFEKNWIRSRATKAESQDMQFDGEWGLTETHSRVNGDGALLLKSKARHHAIGAKLAKPFVFKNEKQLVLQYEVQFRNGQECGGAYIKLLAAPSGSLEQLNDKTPYSIMFGPDKCGNDYKVHFIFMHRNPKNGTLREIHWKRATSVTKLEEAVKDGKWHLLRLVIRSDDTFEVQFDKKSVGKGSLLEEFNPSVNPEKEIDDPHDSKPEDWDEREKIPDPDARKPEEWDENEPRKISDPIAVKPSDWDENEPEMIPDPEASKPADWDVDMDGEWEPPLIANPKCKAISGCGPWSAPLIDNPKYRGKWKPPMIANPNYKGKWAPRKIPNPDYFEDSNPFVGLYAIDAAAFELWTISDGIAFDNVLIANDENVANYVLDHTFQIKKDLADAESDSLLMRLLRYTNKNPWMWAVYITCIVLPVVLFIAFCCVQPVKSSSASDADARRKKTDEPAVDDEVLGSETMTASRASRERSAPKQQTPPRASPPKPAAPVIEQEEFAEESHEDTADEEVEEEIVEEPAESPQSTATGATVVENPEWRSRNGNQNEHDEPTEEEEEEVEEEEAEEEEEEEVEVRSSPRLRKNRPRRE